MSSAPSETTCGIPVRPTASSRSGPALSAPDLTIWTDHAAFAELSLGRTSLMDLVTARRARLSGDAATVGHAARMFSATHYPWPGAPQGG